MMLKGTVYLQVGKDRYGGLKVERATSSKPKRPMSGTLTVKLTLCMPKEAFDPLEPEAEIVIGEGFTKPNPVRVEVELPDIDEGSDENEDVPSV